jgi:transposase
MQTKKQTVKEFLEKGASAKEAATLTGTSLQYVYDIKSDLNRDNGVPKRRGRPRKTETVQAPVNDVALKEIEDRFMETLKLKQEISDLTAVIVYLEHRLKAYGAAI